MHAEAITHPTGALGLRVIRNSHLHLPSYRDAGSGLGRMLTTQELVHHGFPRKGLPDEVNDWRADNVALHFGRTRKLTRARRVAQANGLPYLWSQLWLAKIRADGSRLELGLASCHVVTTAGVNFLVDALQGTVEPEILRFHGFGTGGTAEASGDTALVTEETTQYNPDNTRPTGTLTEGASANIFRTVGTYSPDSGGTRAITEHGIFSQAATGGGTLLDRSLFAVQNIVASADSLEATYELTLTAGG